MPSTCCFLWPLMAASAAPVDLAQLPPERRLDFLVGDWQATAPTGLTWAESIVPIMHGQALQSTTGNATAIYSWVPPAGEWRMTWVSDVGHHDALVRGGLHDGQMVFHQPVLRDRPGMIGRLTYSEIRGDGFHVDWHVSADDGGSWTLELSADYGRVQHRARPSEQTPAALNEGARAALGDELFRLGHWYVSGRWQGPAGEVPGRGEIVAVVGADQASIVETLWMSVNHRQRISRVRTYRWDAESGAVTIVNAQAGRPEHRGRIERDAEGMLERDRVSGPEGEFDAVYRYEQVSPDHYRARRSEERDGEFRADAFVYDAYRAP